MDVIPSGPTTGSARSRVDAAGGAGADRHLLDRAADQPFSFAAVAVPLEDPAADPLFEDHVDDLLAADRMARVGRPPRPDLARKDLERAPAVAVHDEALADRRDARLRAVHAFLPSFLGRRLEPGEGLLPEAVEVRA
jgi:hypothetical protein